MDSVSTVVLTFNAARTIRDVLKALKGQTIPGRITVIDSSSTDDTAKIVNELGIELITIEKGEFDHGGTRTFAVKRAESDIVVFLTQDAIPANDQAIENLVRPFSDANVAAAYGRQLPYLDANPFAAHLRLFWYPETPQVRRLQDRDRYGLDTPFLSNSFAAYRKRSLEAIGYFKQRMLYGEDYYAGAKLLMAGHAIAYVPDALVTHSHNYTMVEEMRRFFDTGVLLRSETWIRREFGATGHSGWPFIRSELLYVLRKRNPVFLVEFFLRNMLRFIGYVCGAYHAVLPAAVRQRMSMHPAWWKRQSS